MTNTLLQLTPNTISCELLLPVVLSLIFYTSNARSESVKVLNIQWQPYYYKSHEDISGYAKDIVAKVTENAGVEADFQFDHWDTVFEEGLSVPNTVIAGIGRTQKREALFHWIGPINRKQNIYAYGLKSKQIDIKQIEDIGNYLTAVERNMYYHDFMVKMGFKQQTYPVSDITSLFKLLMIGRVDFILLEKERIDVEFPNLGYDLSLIEAKALAFSAQSYMTISKTSNEKLVQRLATSYSQLQSRGEIQGDRMNAH